MTTSNIFESLIDGTDLRIRHNELVYDPSKGMREQFGDFHYDLVLLGQPNGNCIFIEWWPDEGVGGVIRVIIEKPNPNPGRALITTDQEECSRWEQVIPAVQRMIKILVGRE